MEQKPSAPHSRFARILALIAALIVIAGSIFLVFQPGKSQGGDASLLPTAYAVSTEKPWKDLKKGSSGEYVRRIQYALSELGYYDGRQDGNFSKSFEEAVLAFQQDWGLTADGVIDRETYDLLTADLPDALPAPSPTEAPAATAAPAASPTPYVIRGESYSDKDHVAAYLKAYGELPPNYITKSQATALGWVNTWGNLWQVAPGKSIGGDRFGNYEGKLPVKAGRKYFECDIDYDPDEDRGRRGKKRIIYSSDGLIFYTEDHYNTFEEIK